MYKGKCTGISVSFFDSNLMSNMTVVFYRKKGASGHSTRSKLFPEGISFHSVRRAQQLQMKMAEEVQHEQPSERVCRNCQSTEQPTQHLPIYYDEIALVRFHRHSDTRYRVALETHDGRQSIIAEGMGCWLAEHLADGLVANGVRVWFWDAVEASV